MLVGVIVTGITIGAGLLPHVDHVIGGAESFEWSSVLDIPDHSGLHVVFHSKVEMAAVAYAIIATVENEIGGVLDGPDHFGIDLLILIPEVFVRGDQRKVIVVNNA